MVALSRLPATPIAPEPGESLVDCARRETLEETGFRVELAPETDAVVTYALDWNGAPGRPCTTHFFFAKRLEAPDLRAEVHDADYHRGVVWVPLAELEERLAYGTGIYAAVRSLIDRYGPGR